MVGDAEILTAIVKPVAFVVHQRKIFRSAENATDLYRVPRGSNLMMTDRGSAEVVIIWSPEIDFL